MLNIGRWSREHPFTTAIALTLACAPLVLAVAWMASGRWQAQRLDVAIEHEAAREGLILNDAEAVLKIAFGQVASAAAWIAEDEETIDVLLAHPDHQDKENRLLGRVTTTFGIDYAHLMSAKGEVVASSMAGSKESTLGSNLGHRDYFREALRGAPSRQFAVGEENGSPGFYFSVPVKHKDEVIGVAVTKLDLASLQARIHLPDGAITDRYGVVVVADNQAYRFSTMPGSRIGELSKEQAMKRYARTDFPALDLIPAGLEGHPEVMLLKGEPVRISSRVLDERGWKVYVVNDFSALTDLRRLRFTLFAFASAAVCGMLFGLWASLFYFLNARNYRRRLEAANIDLTEQATRDFLTGCLNRRAFSDALNKEMSRAQRYDTSFSVAMMDIDYFKRINDSRGHDGGDVALRFLSAQISANMRSSDTLARLGGEEFVWMMPNTSMDVAAEVVDRMRETIANMPVTGLEPPLMLTFSAGVAEWQTGVDEQTLLNAADEALYKAKEGGRNRVLKSTKEQ